MAERALVAVIQETYVRSVPPRAVDELIKREVLGIATDPIRQPASFGQLQSAVSHDPAEDVSP